MRRPNRTTRSVSASIRRLNPRPGADRIAVEPVLHSTSIPFFGDRTPGNHFRSHATELVRNPCCCPNFPSSDCHAGRLIAISNLAANFRDNDATTTGACQDVANAGSVRRCRLPAAIPVEAPGTNRCLLDRPLLDVGYPLCHHVFANQVPVGAWGSGSWW